MFDYCYLFDGSNSITELQAWNTSSITSMKETFRNCTVFNVDISGWNTSSVTNMQGMFKNAGYFRQKMDTWNTTEVTNMSQMFRNTIANTGVWPAAPTSSFNTDISSWGNGSQHPFSSVANVTDMSYMFEIAYN